MPTKPITARDYKKAGIPWFKYYAEDKKPLQGSKTLIKLKSIRSAITKKEAPIEAITAPVIDISPKQTVSDGDF